jgi:hypothetical protein
MSENNYPQSRTEIILNDILGKDYPLEYPQSNVEKILQNMLGKDWPIDIPTSRIEKLLYKILKEGPGPSPGKGSGTIPFSNILDCIESTKLVGLKQSTAPTTTGDNPQVYEDENHIWHNLYWLDDSVTPNVWKKYNTATEQWELVNGGNE